VKQGLERQLKERAYNPFDWLRLRKEYIGKWEVICEIVGNHKLPEGRTSKNMPQVRQEATRYLL